MPGRGPAEQAEAERAQSPRGARVLAQHCSCGPGHFALTFSRHIGRSGLSLLLPRCPGRPGAVAPEQHGRPRRWSVFPSTRAPRWPPRSRCAVGGAGGRPPGLQLLGHRSAGSRPPILNCRCCCSAAKSCQALCDPVGCSTPGLPVHHQVWEFAQTHVH